MNKLLITLLATMLVTFVLGSVHAFSVFIVPLEALLGLPRSQVSLIYSLALVALTLAVLLGYRIYGLLPAGWLVFLTCLIAAAGLRLAATASDWWQLVLGYSLVFGFSNGVGYGFCLQLVARVMPQIKGFAMGAVTAAYAVGSIVFAKIFASLIAAVSVEAALTAIALAVLASGIIAGTMLALSRARYTIDAERPIKDLPAIDRLKVVQFWLAYMTSVFAGLMAIGHAAGIALSKNAEPTLATLAAITIGIGSATGGFVAGYLVDRWPATRFLVGLPLLSAIALLLIGWSDSATITVTLLCLVGFSYGSIIAIYPVVISNYFGDRGPQVYGQVFIAWGFAGLLAPWSAGLIYDWRTDYALAMAIAAAIAIVSALCAGSFRLEKLA